MKNFHLELLDDLKSGFIDKTLMSSKKSKSKIFFITTFFLPSL